MQSHTFNPLCSHRLNTTLITILNKSKNTKISITQEFIQDLKMALMIKLSVDCFHYDCYIIAAAFFTVKNYVSTCMLIIGVNCYNPTCEKTLRIKGILIYSLSYEKCMSRKYQKHYLLQFWIENFKLQNIYCMKSFIVE